MAYILIGLIVCKSYRIVTAVKTAIIGIKTALVGTNVASCNK